MPTRAWTPTRAASDAERATGRAADSADRAYRALRQRLIEFRFRPGESIREARIAVEMNLSRTPVREALSRLASEGFVRAVPNRGFVVRSLDLGELVDVHEVRAVVEAAAFVRMCACADDEKLAELSRLWQSVQPAYVANEADQILEADERFHMLIAEASGNSEFVAMLGMINARIRFIRRILIERGRDGGALVADHDRIVAAALARDGQGGAALLRAHIELSVDLARDALKDALLRMHSTTERTDRT